MLMTHDQALKGIHDKLIQNRDCPITSQEKDNTNETQAHTQFTVKVTPSHQCL